MKLSEKVPDADLDARPVPAKAPVPPVVDPCPLW
jgi:hypothetical protein